MKKILICALLFTTLLSITSCSKGRSPKKWAEAAADIEKEYWELQIDQAKLEIKARKLRMEKNKMLDKMTDSERENFEEAFNDYYEELAEEIDKKGKRKVEDLYDEFERYQKEQEKKEEKRGYNDNELHNLN